MSDKPNEYVLGFVFDETGGVVLLMRKRRPEWQRNKFNGIGGHIKEDESPTDAMVRECEEETGEFFEPADWHLCCIMRGSWGVVHVFSVFTERVTGMEADADEPVSIHPLDKLPPNVIPNVRWLVPMCASFTLGEHARSFEVRETP